MLCFLLDLGESKGLEAGARMGEEALRRGEEEEEGCWVLSDVGGGGVVVVAGNLKEAILGVVLEAISSIEEVVGRE